jgi:quercetin dioxygenase-like cupin family protein
MERPAGAEEKAWGWSERLWDQTYIRQDGTTAIRCRVVRVFIRAGGYSSIHRHKESSNIFSVISGRLTLHDYIEGEKPNHSAKCSLEAGDHPLAIPAGCLHQFEAEQDTLALEIYIAMPEGDASAADIERFSDNGCKETVAA